MKALLFSIFLLVTIVAQGQKIKLFSTGVTNSFRGLSVVNDSTFWVSGNKGTVGFSSNYGKSFTWFTIGGYEKVDFRDIHAFTESSAIIMGIDSPAYILKTIDKGKTWNKVYENNTSGIFLDALDFYDEKSGIVIGDPIKGKMFFATTTDAGNTWQEKTDEFNITVTKGEAAFASSGSNIKMINDKDFVAITGGIKSSLIQNRKMQPIPIMLGKESTGANALAVLGNRIIIVGGDFNAKDFAVNNCAIWDGKKWKSPKRSPTGYRSCVEHITGKKLIACGLNGVDWTTNNGKTFKKISKIGFHSCKKSKSGKFIYLSGGQGKIGLIQL
jgi:hypothetical protein